MLIAIDGNEANVKERVGVSMYTYQLLSYFASWASEDLQFSVILRNKPLKNMPREHAYFTYTHVPGRMLWRDIFLPLHLLKLKKKPDVFFSPAHYTPLFTSIPVVVTIHDVSYLYYPHEFLSKDLYKLQNWTAHALHQSKKVIAVSNFTRNDIMKKYHITPGKIVTIYNGYNAGKAKNVHGSTKNYILYVGTLQPRKNIKTLINSFAEVKKQMPHIKLVIAGKKGWMYDDLFVLVQKHDIGDSVEFTDYVDDNKLAQLYADASLFVLPSLYEGFGITILEAMHYGAPVLAAQGSCLEEIGGDACEYFDPHDTMKLRDAMMKIIKDPARADRMRQKGFERVRQFSWEKCAKETLNALKST